MNRPEQLEFTTNAILVGEPSLPRAPFPKVTTVLDLTPSDLQTLRGCFRFFHWTRILGIAEPGRGDATDSPQMLLGSMAHKILEHDTPPSMDALTAAGLSDLSGVFTRREWKDLVAASPERELPFIMHLDVQGKDCWIRGRMDAALPAGSRSGTGVPRVVDYKYAAWREGAEVDYEFQMTTYALALMKATGADRAIAELWYLKPPMQIIQREYTLAEAEAALRGTLSRYLDAVERSEWRPAERSYCDRIECGFREQCWSAT
jgi:CRISPR/Cas system-associated exonuclease Cas4 (RecB family)